MQQDTINRIIYLALGAKEEDALNNKGDERRWLYKLYEACNELQEIEDIENYKELL